jgi:hypothetical protein
VVAKASSVSLSQASRALLAVVDRLKAEFPEVPLSVVHAQVGEARAVAARCLPDVEKYREALEGDARIRLGFEENRARF